jgi:alkylation response protein AidB-like acyl-CoA dehydrogenase
MDFEIPAELMEPIDSVRSVLVQECATVRMRDIVEKGGAPEQPWKSARELNWTSIDLPESLGGLELGFTALGLVIEQHGCCIAPGPFLGSQTLRVRRGPGCARVATETVGVDALDVDFEGCGYDSHGPARG